MQMSLLLIFLVYRFYIGDEIAILLQKWFTCVWNVFGNSSYMHNHFYEHFILLTLPSDHWGFSGVNFGSHSGTKF